MKPLTAEQKRFAEQHHNVVLSYLVKKKLPPSLYYDVVVFGYLQAVQTYWENPELRQYEFSTICWKRMNSSLSNYYCYLTRKKRGGTLFRLDDYCDRSKNITWGHVTGKEDENLEMLETTMVLHQLLRKIPRKNRNVLIMKARGERMCDIAKAEHLSYREINRIVREAHQMITQELCNC